jgi:hypothetical protein
VISNVPGLLLDIVVIMQTSNVEIPLQKGLSSPSPLMGEGWVKVKKKVVNRLETLYSKKGLQTRSKISVVSHKRLVLL